MSQLKLFQDGGVHILHEVEVPTYRGIGEEKGDRRLARECHANILKKKTGPPTERKAQVPNKAKTNAEVTHDHALPLLEQPEQQVKKRRVEEEKLAAVEELKDIQVVEGEPKKATSIRTTMEQRMEEELVHFLKANSDVFAWTVHDLVGIGPKVMTNKLNVNPTF
ncbi:UNVERIFIED_CONTAM: hypothetical protein Slati_0817900 [Sesamum latifolium]|uniref:Uncharacterized protein n=1 Tax=Sesamum latifolium TaxID=2727402 RepID=A0AAW2XPC3_9LAMI